ncbi:MAG: DNA-binding protein WhiA [Eubacteriales bacterium]|nr:DNA-binding protein WhiA [Eubacteriales bacterium]
MSSSLVQKLQAEAVEVLRGMPDYWPLALELFKSTALRVSGRSMSFTSRRKDFFDLLLDILKLCGEQGFTVVKQRQVMRISWRESRELEQIRETIRVFLVELETIEPTEFRALAKLSETENTPASIRQCILCMLYLSIGALSEPADAYHLELAFPRILPGRIMQDFLQSYALNFKVLDRQSARILYLKDGEELGNFLLSAGCSNTYLDYSQLRVEKEVKNQVNRVVNCDSANASRLAEASARQYQAIRLIEAKRGLKTLPLKLREAAELRLAHPGLSLEELGAKLSPPLGKSGINHRLKKIESIALELSLNPNTSPEEQL